ncbi:Type I restriction-modification system, restriction subunit R [Polaromonas sp. CG9_12]|nr:Type I restriction-modification system, restriction subunit R [Polaromonas sp. CG9_12]
MDKKKLSESDICDKFIRPAMERAGWNGLDQIYREYPLRAGRLVVRGSKAQRDKSTVLFADYALFFKANIQPRSGCLSICCKPNTRTVRCAPSATR